MKHINNKFRELEGAEEINEGFTKLWYGDSMHDNQLNVCMSKMAEFIDSNLELRTQVNKGDSIVNLKIIPMMMKNLITYIKMEANTSTINNKYPLS